jgi:hypothetical protein
MGIIRVEKTGNYSIISNVCLRDDNISMKAKGLYSYLVTLPDNWVIYQQELLNHFPDGRTAISAAMDELEKYGYMRKERTRGADGRMSGWDYTLYEHPQVADNQASPPKSGFPKSVNPKSENQQLPKTDYNQDTNSTKNTLCGFDDFWNVWPKHERKSNKQRCMALWRSKKLYECHTEVIAAVERWKLSKQWTKDGGEFIPGPDKWLFQEKWLSADAIKTTTVQPDYDNPFGTT